ncbi:MAG: hypothetical protein MZV63_48035 [Marinilabiliales bacterium]|nr:hypothetical protein [Marinilabiliales bacterium]
MLRHILFTAGFSLLFLNLYTPFGVPSSFRSLQTDTLLLYASGVILDRGARGCH